MFKLGNFKTLTGTAALAATVLTGAPAIAQDDVGAILEAFAADYMTDPTFTSDVQSELNDADWFQSTLGTQVNSALGAENVRNQLSTIINKALASLT